MNHTSSKNPQIQKRLEKCHELLAKQDQTLLWTCVAGARRCVNSRYAKFKYTGMKSDYIQILQCNLQQVT